MKNTVAPGTLPTIYSAIAAIKHEKVMMCFTVFSSEQFNVYQK